MNCKIPFTKDIDFERKLYEITSISLEHEIKVEEGTLKGNFIVSGDYKSHEVSVNKEPFSYILPFEISLAEDIDENTVEFMIEDFTYEIIENKILRVNIDFNVIGSKKEEPSPKEESTDRLFKETTDLFPESNDMLEPINTVLEEDTQVKTETLKNTTEKINIQDNNINENVTTLTENKTTTSEDTIINNLKVTDDEYATYHIHMVSDGESVETICNMYNSDMSHLSEYNDLSSLTAGDKLIIPDSNE